MLGDSWVTYHPSHHVKFVQIPGQYLDNNGDPDPRFEVRMKAEVGIGDPTVCLYFFAFDMTNRKELDPFLAIEVPFEMLERMTEMFSRVVPKTTMVDGEDLE